MIAMKINGISRQFHGDPNMPLLWYVRDELGLTGSKFGCGMALCAPATMHVGGDAVRSCVTPVSVADGKEVTTIEGLRPERQPPRAAGVARAQRAPVRLLPVRGRSCRPRPCSTGTPTERRRDRHRDGREHLPLRHPTNESSPAVRTAAQEV